MPMDDDRKEKSRVSCSFCHKTQDQVQKIIAGDGVYICNECVELCHSIMEEQPSGPVPGLDIASLPKPHEIKAQLDELSLIHI